MKWVKNRKNFLNYYKGKLDSLMKEEVISICHDEILHGNLGYSKN